MLRNAKWYKETSWLEDIKAFLLLSVWLTDWLTVSLLGTITRSVAIASYSAAALKKQSKCTTHTVSALCAADMNEVGKLFGDWYKIQEVFYAVGLFTESTITSNS